MSQQFYGRQLTLTQSENRAEINRLTSDLQTKIITNTKKMLSDMDINFTGNLSDSIKKGINQYDERTVEITSPYAVPVEFGMPAGIHVNFDELRKWVEGKLGVSKDESKDVTFSIWKKILDKGIPQTRFFKKAIKLTIGEVGILNLRISRPKDKWLKRIKKFNRGVKKVTKYIKKFNKVRKKLNKI